MRVRVLLGLVAAGLVACGGSKEIEDKRSHITKSFLDPASAQFRGETLRGTGWLCGEVNAKNAMGSYSGFKRFSVKDAGNAYLEGVGNVGGGNAAYQQIMEDLNLEIEVLKEAKEQIEAGTLTKEASQNWMKARTFEKRWQGVCS